MSGPKVVRIVTREEIMQRYQRLLNQLDSAISQWRREISLFGCDSQLADEMMIKRRQHLQSLFDSDQFTQLQKAVPLELEFLTIDIAERREQAVLDKAAQLQQQRQQRENAGILLAQLQNKQIMVPVALLSEIEAIKKGELLVSNALQQGLGLLQQQALQQSLQQSATGTLSVQQQEILDKMVGNQSIEGVGEWLAINKPRSSTPALQKLDRYLSEMLLSYPSHYSVYATRLQQIENEMNPMQYHLLLDSLNLDLALELQHRNQRKTLMARLEQLIAETQLQQLQQPVLAQLNIMQLADVELAEIEQLIVLCETHLAQKITEQTALYRRQVMLDGLAKLGYEVREGMSTLWQKQGKVVLNNPAMPGYGVEVGSQDNVERLQIRPVRLTPVEDKHRDIDAEMLWCGDFNKLKQWMEQQGDGLQLERSLPVGQVAVKYIAADSSENTISQQQVNLRQ